MNSSQFLRWLKKHRIEIGEADSQNHVTLYNPATGKTSSLPRHGGRQQLKKGLMEGIKKQLRLK